MRLHPEPFHKIRTGEKTVEIRLNDEKRQRMKVGERIEFSLRPNFEEKFLAEIIGLDTFKSFKEAFSGYLPKQYGGQTKDEWKSMYQYYSPEDEQKYGILGIRLRRLL